MKGGLPFALLALAAAQAFSGTARAQQAGQPQVTARWLFSNDTDNFSSERVALGYLWSNGWGLEARASHFSSPGWSADGQTLSGVYRSHTEDTQIDARLGLDQTRHSSSMAGMLDAMHRLTPDTSAGVSLERDVVDSVVSIDNHIRYTAAAAVLDHAFTDRANVGASLGNIWYSDGNQRRLLRTRWNYEVVKDSGLNAYVKTRHFWDTDPYNGYYFAPDRVQEYSVGMSWRTALTDSVVLVAQGDGGRQFIDGEGQGLWYAQIGLESRPRAPVQWRVAFEVRNDAGSARDPNATNYRYSMLAGYLLFPLK